MDYSCSFHRGTADAMSATDTTPDIDITSISLLIDILPVPSLSKTWLEKLRTKDCGSKPEAREGRTQKLWFPEVPSIKAILDKDKCESMIISQHQVLFEIGYYPYNSHINLCLDIP